MDREGGVRRMKLNTEMQVNRITDEVWEIPATEKPGMLVPARIYAAPTILESMDSGVFEQVKARQQVRAVIPNRLNQRLAVSVKNRIWAADYTLVPTRTG